MMLISLIVSLINFCISLFDNAIFRYLFNIPVHLLKSTTHLPTFCNNYTGISEDYWIEHTDECDILFTNIIHIHSVYCCVLVILICCCFRFIQNILFKIIFPIIKDEVNNGKGSIIHKEININMAGKETKLKNSFNEKFSNLLKRLLKALDNLKLSKAIEKSIVPFKEEYEELKDELENKLK